MQNENFRNFSNFQVKLKVLMNSKLEIIHDLDDEMSLRSASFTNIW